MKEPARRATRGKRPERRTPPPLHARTPSSDELDHSLTPDLAEGEDATLAPAGLDLLEARYEERELLGSGGSGVVLLAHDRTRDRPVAVKRLRRASPGLVRRLLREARTIAALDHPGIVRLEQVVRTEHDEVALVLEHVPGPDLETLVRGEGPLPLPRALELGLGVAEALAYAHERGVIHRDVKPSNILLGDDGRPKVTDFGLALPLCDPQSLSLTGAADVCGTLDYMAPEQRVDSRAVDGRADVFGLGATLYRLITGTSPRVIRERALPPLARELVLRCVEEAPAARYPSMRALARALEGALSVARGPRATDGTGVEPLARRLIVAAAGLVALGILPRHAAERLRARLEGGASLQDEVPRLVAQVLGGPRARLRPALLEPAHVTLASALAGCDLDPPARWALRKLARAARGPGPEAPRGAAPVGLDAAHVLEQVLSLVRVQALAATALDGAAARARWSRALRELAAALPASDLVARVVEELRAVEDEGEREARAEAA
ncbi:MAG: serine/threonine protein kinase [Planctomycetes bacterium]|nr:serine/threonine protein kinase [Planctomycetota bacterium]